MESEVKLTDFSHGSGCGCKIAPLVLEKILFQQDKTPFPGLLVGNESRDDAAVFDLGNGRSIISTTDFFMPIVNDPFQFGAIASANALSDVYAMGGTPLMALAILGWPVEKLDPSIAQQVLEGARKICKEAGIPLAGGHSIDNPEPLFGLAVTGEIETTNIKRNNTAQEGDLLFLTKPVGTGILSTALKRNIIQPEDYNELVESMMQLNIIGIELGVLKDVNAITDITGFGLAGHILEMAEGSNLTAQIDFSAIPVFKNLLNYTSQFCFPDNTTRNWNSYSSRITGAEGLSFITLCDPQTSGGLLVSVSKEGLADYLKTVKKLNLPDYCSRPIGAMIKKEEASIIIGGTSE